MPTILAVGSDAELLSTRVTVLRLTGATVVPLSPSAALELFEERPLDGPIFDLTVLCHSISMPLTLELCQAVHRQESPGKVLLLLCANNLSDAGVLEQCRADLTMDCGDGPHALVSGVKKMLDLSPRRADRDRTMPEFRLHIVN